jgi:hypothetical protein
MTRQRTFLSPVLSEVFKGFRQAPASIAQADLDSQRDVEREQGKTYPEDLPTEPERSKSGVVTFPSVRFDGDDVNPPWNIPEPILWDLLRTAEVEHIEERVLSGVGGTMWARVRDLEGKVRSALLCFDGIPKRHVYEEYGGEYVLDPAAHDLLTRHLAAWETAKACGMDDLVPPMAAREINLVPLISDAMRERVAREYQIPSIEVDEQLGTEAILSEVVQGGSQFVDHWSMQAGTDSRRWAAASNRLRHSIYRVLILDLICGTADRPLCSLVYNHNLDRVAVTSFAPTFPHIGFATEKYLQARNKGWERNPTAGLKRLPDSFPAHGSDLYQLVMRTGGKGHAEEWFATIEQVGKALDDEIVVHLVNVIAGAGVPPECVAGMVARIGFLKADPMSTMRDPGTLRRTILAPARRGYETSLPVAEQVLSYVSEIMGSVIEGFDVMAALQVELPPDMTFKL